MSPLEGGAYGGVEDLYREVILDHFKSPHNKGNLKGANACADGVNPLCGDQIAVRAVIEGAVVKKIQFDGHGCAISQSSASIMTDLVMGKTIRDVEGLTTLIKELLGVKETTKSSSPKFTRDDLGDYEALEGVKKYPVRIKCALLAWNTLMESLKNVTK